MRQPAMTLVCVVLAGCGQRSDQPRIAPKDARHDDTSHAENHHYLAVTRDGFEPSILAVPTGKELILLVDRKRDATCPSLTIDIGSGASIERTFQPDQLLEIHLAFTSSGSYLAACGSSQLRATLVAQ